MKCANTCWWLAQFCAFRERQQTHTRQLVHCIMYNSSKLMWRGDECKLQFPISNSPMHDDLCAKSTHLGSLKLFDHRRRRRRRCLHLFPVNRKKKQKKLAGIPPFNEYIIIFRWQYLFNWLTYEVVTLAVDRWVVIVRSGLGKQCTNHQRQWMHALGRQAKYVSVNVCAQQWFVELLIHRQWSVLNNK